VWGCEAREEEMEGWREGGMVVRDTPIHYLWEMAGRKVGRNEEEEEVVEEECIVYGDR
jgi:hypothetical protein